MKKQDYTVNQRVARKRQKDREEKGIVGVLVRVHQTRKEEIKTVAKTMLEPKESDDGAER
jgi:hypothetical protein